LAPGADGGGLALVGPRLVAQFLLAFGQVLEAIVADPPDRRTDALRHRN
jgi:hypothetical protein